MLTRILVIGDVVGRPGRSALQEMLPRIIETEAIDLCIANAENAAGGSGVTPEITGTVYLSAYRIMRRSPTTSWPQGSTY